MIREEPDTLDLGEALALAVQLHRAGDLGIAETLYGRILEAAPDYADACQFLGLLKHQTGRSPEAIALLRRAIALAPDEAGIHLNLGNVLFEIGRSDLAAQAFEASLSLDPDQADACSNLGMAFRAMGRFEDAEEVYREGLALDPDHRDLWDNFGRLLASTGRVDEAIAAHKRALELEPRNAETRRLLISAYAAMGETDRALVILRQWLAEEPLNPSARHLVAAISGEDVPERASDLYVETMFDSFASSFERKLARLDYRAPELVGGAVAVACGMPGPIKSILDAGCGTGLVGPYLRPLARRLVGIDLSDGMMAEARRKDVYDELVQVELRSFLETHPDAFDLVVSADTLCYFGPLDAVFAAAAIALRRTGVLVFTVEEETGSHEHRLQTHGRYSHAEPYVRKALAAAGFHSVEVVREALRMERGASVPGLLVTARI